MQREVMEESGLKVSFVNMCNLPIEGNNKENLALPFYVNVHSVGEYYCACSYYLLKVKNSEELSINKELKNYT